MYLPFWTFDSITRADWRAQVGHIKTERYYDLSSRQWKSRTKTVWRWESGRAQLSFDDLLVEGTGRISKLLMDQIKRFDLGQLVKYEAKFLAGIQALAYDTPLESAWEQARQKMRDDTRGACRNQASTPRIRNFSMNLNFDEESWRYILLPVYMASYQYGNDNFQVVINGQSGEIAGQRPVDWGKVWVVIAAILAPGVLVGLGGLLTIGLLGPIIPVIGLALFIAGLIGTIVILVKATSMDDV
jgi:hypothetical protein